MIPEKLPPQVYELLSFLLPRGFVLIEELPDKHLAAFEFSRATDPPLIGVFDLPTCDKLQLAPDLIVDLPKRAVQITAKGKAALALREMQGATEPAAVLDDSNWPEQCQVAERLGVDSMTVGRLCTKGELRTNGKSRKAKRIDPASILEYCDREGLAYNEK